MRATVGHLARLVAEPPHGARSLVPQRRPPAVEPVLPPGPPAFSELPSGEPPAVGGSAARRAAETIAGGPEVLMPPGRPQATPLAPPRHNTTHQNPTRPPRIEIESDPAPPTIRSAERRVRPSEREFSAVPAAAAPRRRETPAAPAPITPDAPVAPVAPVARAAEGDTPAKPTRRPPLADGVAPVDAARVLAPGLRPTPAPAKSATPPVPAPQPDRAPAPAPAHAPTPTLQPTPRPSSPTPPSPPPPPRPTLSIGTIEVTVVPPPAPPPPPSPPFPAANPADPAHPAHTAPPAPPARPATADGLRLTARRWYGMAQT